LAPGRDPEQCQVIRVEAEVDLAQPAEALDQQACPREERECDRELRGRQRRTPPVSAPSAGRRLPPCPQRFERMAANRADERRGSNDRRSNERQRSDERRSAHIEPELGGSRNAVGSGASHKPESPPREKQCDDGRGTSDHDALDER
jgi:hypothetical protein